MPPFRAFISYDFDNDADLKNLLQGQSRNPDTPFQFQDWSVKAELSGDWEAKVRQKIRRCNLVIVICGKNTFYAQGVAKEVRIAQEEGIPYFLLNGRSDMLCSKPSSARADDKLYRWTWDNLKALIAGAR